MPGSVSNNEFLFNHNSRVKVWANSPLRARLEAGWRPFPNAVLLADSAYGANDYTIPPLDATVVLQSNRNRRFNRAHMSTR